MALEVPAWVPVCAHAGTKTLVHFLHGVAFQGLQWGMGRRGLGGGLAWRLPQEGLFLFR